MTLAIGHFNMVRHIVFADGVTWIARVNLPLLCDEPRAASSLKSEVAAIKFLDGHTTVPVPKVHFYQVDSTNEVGAAYILMDYVHGTVATELQKVKKCDENMFSTPEQDRKFRQQMANIQVTLSSCKFGRIGFLYMVREAWKLVIGPASETGKGPWESSAEYYTDLANAALQKCVRYAEPEVQASSSFAIPILAKHLISLCAYKGGLFGLTNRRFGARNLLVNDDFEMVCVIDMDAIMAAPIEVVAQAPLQIGLDREPLGHVETDPARIEHIERTESRLREYRSMIKMAEALENLNNGRGTPIADLMLSEAVRIVEGLLQYPSDHMYVNDKWMEAYLEILRTHIRSGEQGTG